MITTPKTTHSPYSVPFRDNTITISTTVTSKIPLTTTIIIIIIDTTGRTTAAYRVTYWALFFPY